MQTLGLSDSTPRTENRLKSLFWPSIQTADDVDYLGAQGYWVCTIVAVLSLVVSILADHPIAGVFAFLLYYLGGVGVREHSLYASVVVFIFFLADLVVNAIAAGPSVWRILLTALLLANLRATWIASGWKPDSPEAAQPPRFGDTWTDRFVDRLPMWLWPKVRVLYYVFSICFFVLIAVGLAMVALRRPA